MSRVCGQCSHYMGCGDWDLCCGKQQRSLCYEDTKADDCPAFDQTAACRNVTSRVGMFRCSICNAYTNEANVGDTCPECGNAITGAMWHGQRHYAGGTR